MELTEDEVLEILKMIEDSSFDFFQVELGELKLTVAKGGYVPNSGDAAPSPSPAAPPPPAPVAAAPSPPPAESPAGKLTEIPEGLVAITAPMVGTFYVAPDPESPSFVEVGARVDEDTTVALIEVMKVFSAVRSGVSGVVEQVLIPNAGSVEYGQALFLVKPDS